MHMNVQCIKNKINIIEGILENRKPDYLCITEHWLKQQETDFCCIKGYSIASAFCRQTYKNGGAMILCKETIKYKELQNINKLSQEKHCELAALEGNEPNGKHFVMCIYRSPTGDIKTFIDILSTVLDLITNRIGTITVCGDFNIDFNAKTSNTEKDDIISIFATFNLKLCIKDSTRVTLTTSTCIDNIFTNNDSIFRIENINLHVADHHTQIVLWNSERPPEEAPIVTKRIFNTKNRELFKALIREESWTTVYQHEKVDDMFEEFTEIFNKYFNKAFPLDPHKIKPKSGNGPKRPWYTPELQTLANNVKSDYIYSKISEIGNRKYQVSKRKYRQACKKAERTHNNNIVANAPNKCKAAWNIINSKINSKGNARKDISLKIKETEITSHQEIAELFNIYFDKTVNDLTKNLTKENLQEVKDSKRCNKVIFLKPIEAKEFLEIINKIGKKRSTGYDDIPGNIVKSIGTNIMEPLSHIINASFTEGCFPTKLKEAKIIPIYKKGDKEEIGNYRPIALLSTFAKIFETAMYKRLENFITQYELLSNNQHGFTRGKSTTTAVAGFVNNILEARDNHKPAIGIFYDFKKAFDLISHRRLLSKLERLGIAGIGNKWIESYLKNRRQSVHIYSNGRTYISQETTTNIGIPQGSVLSPLLFILFTNDLPESVEQGELTLFADDTTHFLSNPDQSILIEQANKAVSALDNWCNQNDIFLNDAKTICMKYTAKEKTDTSPYIKLHGKSIALQTNTKFLGLHLGDGTDWCTHIDTISKQIASSCLLLKRLMEVAGLAASKLVYHAYIQAKLNYGIILWGNHSKTQRLFKLQKRAVRYMANASRNPTAEVYIKDSCKTLFQRFKIMTLACIYIYQVIMYVVKTNAHKGELTHSHDTRTKQNPKTKKHRHKYYTRSPLYAGVKLYSALPINIKNNTTSFKQNLKSFLLEKSFYKVDEFYKL